MKKVFLLLLALILAACAPQGVQVPQSPVLKFLEKKSGQIAYIGIDGNIYLTDQAATSTTQLTKDVTPETQGTIAYQLPTWSKTGDQVAFIRLEQTGANALTADILVANVDDETAHSVYSSQSEYPFYLYWAPDGKTLTALTTTATQGSMALQSIPLDGSEPRIIDTGSPFYWSWAPDGKTMLVHKNGGNPNAFNQLSFLKLDDPVSEFVMDVLPASFQAPAWSPDGTHILLTTLSAADKSQLVLADSTGEIQKTISEFDINTTFAWASDSKQFAYIKGTEQLTSGTIGSLHVGSVDNDEDIVVDEPIIAFFWSPDAIEVAYFIPTVTQAEGTTDPLVYLDLYILDIASKESRKIATFQPTEGFLSMLPYMDQYHQSTTIWSPDSNNIVISFIDPNGNSGIAIIPSSGVTEPRLLVDGLYASWSWK
ncbi:MAG: hypothetical protein U0V18_04280 [Anaerolineales bacterium]